MSSWRPPNAGPKDLRSLYHWIHAQLRTVGDLIGDEGGGPGIPPGHVHDHDNLLNVTPNQHHNQVHNLYGPDHGDVDNSIPATLRDGLFFNGTDWSLDRRVNWINPYSLGATYEADDLVNDSGWLMIANTTTQERAAPQTVGDPEWTLPSNNFSEYSDNSVIYSGHLYTFTQAGYFRSLRVWVPELTGSTNYRVVIIRNPNGSNPVLGTIEEPVLNENNWTTLTADTILVTAGEELLVYIDALNSGGTTEWAYNWEMATASNTGTPGSGQWNTNIQRTLLRINHLDAEALPVDHQIELQVVPDTLFEISEVSQPENYTHYRVVGQYSEQLGYTEYTVTIAEENNGGPSVGAPTQIRAVQPVAQATKFVGEDSYWGPGTLPDWAGVMSYLQFDGVSQPVNGDEAYGIDIAFQPLVASADWDVVYAPGSGGGGGGGGGELTPHSLGFHDDVTITSPLNKQGLIYNAVSGQWENTDIELGAVDGGFANSVYTQPQHIDGGGA